MKKKNSDIMSNEELFALLSSSDPAPAPTAHGLLSLENSIMAQINLMPAREVENAVFLPEWFMQNPLAQQIAAFAIILIVSAGFLVGQVSFGVGKTSALSANTSLFAAASGTDEHPYALTGNIDGDDDAE